MHRMFFEKTGDSVYLSHLDLIRVFQRVFARSGLMLKHSQGFSPKPYVAVALPLSVGVHSVCEIMDFELENDASVPADLLDRLNGTLPAGLRIREIYESSRKTKEIALLSAVVALEYDNGIPHKAEEKLRDLFCRDALVVRKHSKKGDVDTDILPMIRELSVCAVSEQELELRCTVCAQNPTLNPMLLLTAIENYLPEVKPDFAVCRRMEIYDIDGKIFR